jgi:DNA-binding CsgD family transcriptional regulator
MLVRRRCAHARTDGQPCAMAPLRDRPYCFSHDPERAEEAADARRLGGLRRRREGTIAVAYEQEVLELLAAGRSDGEIGEALFITKKTASTHVANIKDKLGAESRVEMAMMASRLVLSDHKQPKVR